MALFSSFLKRKVRDHLPSLDSAALEVDTLLTRAHATACHFFESYSLPSSVPLGLTSLSSSSSFPPQSKERDRQEPSSSPEQPLLASDEKKKKKESSLLKQTQAQGHHGDEDQNPEKEEEEEEEERRGGGGGTAEGEEQKKKGEGEGAQGTAKKKEADDAAGSREEKRRRRTRFLPLSLLDHQREKKGEGEGKKEDSQFDVEAYRQSTRLRHPLPADQVEKFRQILRQILLLARHQKAADALKRKAVLSKRHRQKNLSSTSCSRSSHLLSSAGGRLHRKEDEEALQASRERKSERSAEEERAREENEDDTRGGGSFCHALANHPYGIRVVCASLHLQHSPLLQALGQGRPTPTSSSSSASQNACSSSAPQGEEGLGEKISGILQDALEILEILFATMMPSLYKEIEERRNASLGLEPDPWGVCTPEQEESEEDQDTRDDGEEEDAGDDDLWGFGRECSFIGEESGRRGRRTLLSDRYLEMTRQSGLKWLGEDKERRRGGGGEREDLLMMMRMLISGGDGDGADSAGGGGGGGGESRMFLSGVYVHLMESVMSHTMNGDLVVSLLLLPEVYIQHAGLLIIQKLYTSCDTLLYVARSKISFYRREQSLKKLLLHHHHHHHLPASLSNSLPTSLSPPSPSSSSSSSSLSFFTKKKKKRDTSSEKVFRSSALQSTKKATGGERTEEEDEEKEGEKKLELERLRAVSREASLMRRCLENSFLTRPWCINRLTNSLQEDRNDLARAEFLRHEALEVLTRLSKQNRDLQIFITFQVFPLPTRRLSRSLSSSSLIQTYIDTFGETYSYVCMYTPATTRLESCTRG